MARASLVGVGQGRPRGRSVDYRPNRWAVLACHRRLAERTPADHGPPQRLQLRFRLRLLDVFQPASRQRNRAVVQELGFVAVRTVPKNRPALFLCTLDQSRAKRVPRHHWTHHVLLCSLLYTIALLNPNGVPCPGLVAVTFSCPFRARGQPSEKSWSIRRPESRRTNPLDVT